VREARYLLSSSDGHPTNAGASPDKPGERHPRLVIGRDALRRLAWPPAPPACLLRAQLAFFAPSSERLTREHALRHRGDRQGWVWRGPGVARRGDVVRALVRDPASASLPAGTQLVRGDIRAPDLLAEDLDGIDGMFLVWPFLDADRADEVVEVLAGRARRIVYLSAEAAARRPDSFWATVERAVERFAHEWTFLRASAHRAVREAVREGTCATRSASRWQP
jgi:hypothetical protein